jgi:uncharacterized RDD family membrane protein YckC
MQTMQTETTDLFLEDPIVYGGFWERFGAALLDVIIIAIPQYIIQFTVGEIEGNIAGILIGWLYAALMESSERQATFGKQALGLKVTNLNGDRISFGQATGRHFGKWISTLILLIGYLMMIWDDKKQTLHDKIAGTLVVKK